MLRGHITQASLEAALATLASRIGAGETLVVIDCRHMTGYDLASRHAFVEWNTKWRRQVNGVAILTSNRLWWMVIAGMSLASGQTMKAFDDEQESERWLTALGTR